MVVFARAAARRRTGRGAGIAAARIGAAAKVGIVVHALGRCAAPRTRAALAANPGVLADATLAAHCAFLADATFTAHCALLAHPTLATHHAFLTDPPLVAETALAFVGTVARAIC